MPTEDDISPAEALERALHAAALEERFDDVMQMMRAAPAPVPDQLRNDLLGAAMTSNQPAFLKFIIEDQKTEVDSLRLMLMLNHASRENLQGNMFYLVTRAALAGMTVSDIGDCVFAPMRQNEAALIDPLLDSFAAARLQNDDTLTALLESACAKKRYDAARALLDRGARTESLAPAMELTLCAATEKGVTEAETKIYLDTLRRLTAFLPQQGLDLLLTLNVTAIISGNQCNEALPMLIAQGADPFAFHRLAFRSMTEKFEEAGKSEESSHWREFFTQAQEDYTAAAARRFDTLFADGFTIADLRRPLAGTVACGKELSETGFMLAARARLLHKVVEQANREKTAPLLLEDIAYEEKNRTASVLALAADRGDLLKILDPGYWLPVMPDILAQAEQRLPDTPARARNFEALHAAYNQHRLRQKPASPKLRVAPRP